MIHCLHGAVGNHRDWDLLREALNHDLIAHDLWKLADTGPASLPGAGQQISSMAHDGDILIAYSMGGRIALHALLATPGKWKAAVIISTHPGLSKGHDERLRSDSKWADLANQDWKGFLKKWNTQDILSSKMNGMIQATAPDQDAVAKSFLNWSLGTQKNLLSQLPGLSLPVLWLTGEYDEKFTQLGQKASLKLPNARHQVLSNCGHRVPWEKPDEFAQLVINFLSNR